jgi:sarcosine oxidase subunit beta
VTHAEVVIVGGGVMGTSAAFHLAEAGVEGILLLEQDELGSGSTS